MKTTWIQQHVYGKRCEDERYAWFSSDPSTIDRVGPLLLYAFERRKGAPVAGRKTIQVSLAVDIDGVPSMAFVQKECNAAPAGRQFHQTRFAVLPRTELTALGDPQRIFEAMDAQPVSLGQGSLAPLVVPSQDGAEVQVGRTSDPPLADARGASADVPRGGGAPDGGAGEVPPAEAPLPTDPSGDGDASEASTTLYVRPRQGNTPKRAPPDRVETNRESDTYEETLRRSSARAPRGLWFQLSACLATLALVVWLARGTGDRPTGNPRPSRHAARHHVAESETADGSTGNLAAEAPLARSSAHISRAPAGPGGSARPAALVPEASLAVRRDAAPAIGARPPARPRMDRVEATRLLGY